MLKVIAITLEVSISGITRNTSSLRWVNITVPMMLSVGRIHTVVHVRDLMTLRIDIAHVSIAAIGIGTSTTTKLILIIGVVATDRFVTAIISHVSSANAQMLLDECKTGWIGSLEYATRSTKAVRHTIAMPAAPLNFARIIG